MPGTLTQSIAAATAVEFWSALLAAAVAAGWLLRSAYRLLAHRRLIEDMPTTRLRAAAQGYVELSGTARLFDGEPIVAPLSGRRCCWYRCSIEQRERGDRGHDTRWRRLEQDESTGLFMLDDGTGRCAVDPEGASVTPSQRLVWYGRSRIPPRPPGRRSRWAHLLDPLFGGDFRYREETIDLGAPLHALGFFRTHGGAATPVDTSSDASALLREWKADRADLLARFDRNRDGEIDGAEWERARHEAHAAVAAARTSKAHAPPAVDVLARPHDGAPYLLAVGHEEDLTGRHGWSGALCLALGTGLAMSLLWALGARLVGAH